MNRKSSCYLLLLLACVIAIYSCDKVFEKESNPVDSRFDVYAAKSYLHDSLKVNSEHLVLGSPAALKKINSLAKAGINRESQNHETIGHTFWEKAVSYKLGNYEVVETPFLVQNKVISLYGFADTVINSEKLQEQRANASYTNLVVYKSDKANAVFVTYIPDGVYLEHKKSNRTRFTLNNIPADFSGYLEYKNWNQEILFIVRVSNGVVEGRHVVSSENVSIVNVNKRSPSNEGDRRAGIMNSTASSNVFSCNMVCTPIYQEICAGPIENAGGGVVGDYDPNDDYCTTTQVGTTCEYVCDWGGGNYPDPPLPGGGSGGSGGGEGGVPSEAALKNQIMNKPFALLPSDIPCETIMQWLETAKHQIQQAQVNKLNSIINTTVTRPGISTTTVARLQNINNAYSTVVNMDYFPVTITQMPMKNGVRQTPAQFLEHIRKNMNSFVNTNLAEFSPYNYYGVDDRNLWNSSNPLNAVVAIDIEYPDNGSVIVSKYSSSGWTFSTIFDPKYGQHPVSGNRDFGYTQNANGSYTFYTRGVDRLTSIDGHALNYMANFFGSTFPFSSADNLWISFQSKIDAYVKVNGGTSTINATEIYRPNWSQVRDVLDGRKPLSSLSKDCND